MAAGLGVAPRVFVGDQSGGLKTTYICIDNIYAKPSFTCPKSNLHPSGVISGGLLLRAFWYIIPGGMQESSKLGNN